MRCNASGREEVPSTVVSGHLLLGKMMYAVYEMWATRDGEGRMMGG